MRRGFLILTGLIPFAAMAEEEPRISELLPVAGVPSRMMATFADAEGDGDLDLFFVNKWAYDAGYSPGVVRIENLGNRRFANPQVIAYRHNSGNELDNSEMPIDIDRDGKLDLAVSTMYEDHERKNGPVAVILGTDGKAVRRERLAEPIDGDWKSVDLEGNRQMTLVEIDLLPNDTGATVKLWKYAAGGTLDRWNTQSFTLPIVPAVHTIDVKDIDGDGDFDLIFGEDSHSRDTGYALERTGDSTFAEIARPLTSLRQVTWADLDGDGDLDPSSTDDSQLVTWQINHGNFTFSEVQTTPLISADYHDWQLLGVTSASGAPALVTFSHRVYDPSSGETLRLVQLRFGTWETIVDQLIGDSKTFTHPTRNWAISGFRDLDRDGFPDAVINVEIPASRAGDPNAPARLGVVWGKASGFTNLAWITDAPMRLVVPFPGDFDRDGDLDLVVGPNVDGHTLLLKNDGKGSFGSTRQLGELLPPWLIALGGQAWVLECADLDGNGTLDLLVDYHREGEDPNTPDRGVTTAFGKGNGTFIIPGLQRVAAANSRNYFNLMFGAFLSDLRALLAGIKTWRQISWPTIPTAAQLRQRPIFSNTLNPATSHIYGFADMDGDHDLDAIEYGGWQENFRGELRGGIRPMLGGTKLMDLLGNFYDFGDFTAGDLDGDQRMDFVSLFHGEEPEEPMTFPNTHVAIGYGDGKGGIASTSKLEVKLGSSDLLGNWIPGRTAIVDMDGDGLNDFVAQTFLGFETDGNMVTGSRWWRNPGGGSRDPNSWAKADLPLPIANGFKRVDFDGNGTLEWANSNGYLTSNVQGFQFNGPYNFTGAARFAVLYQTASPHAIADFDGDGDADLLYVGSYPFYGFVSHLSLVRNTIIDERVPKQKPVFRWPVKGRYRR